MALNDWLYQTSDLAEAQSRLATARAKNMDLIKGKDLWNIMKANDQASYVNTKQINQYETYVQGLERKSLAAQQQVQMQQMQQQQLAASEQQQATVADLQAQKAAQDLRIGQMQDVANTVANSLRILGLTPTTQAPTAQVSKPKTVRGAAVTTPGSALRIGSTGRTAGVGTNLGV